ncbi:MAG: hypothetical protein IJN02_06835 [Bacteroidales bacterium]|nr:hypothetical protein [Bacteroidales bacterium]MBQ6688938.1 hypothetical protein [Bacteroidales bacterium]
MKRFITAILLMTSLTYGWAGSRKNSEPVEPFDRGIGKSTSVFVPKGTVAAGVNFSYRTFELGQNVDDPGFSMLFNLVNGLKGSLYTFGLAPHLSYFVADNLSIGARFDYDRTSADIGNAALSISEDMGFGIADYHMLKNTFSGSLTMRYYMAIANSKRFAIFAEARATGAYGESKTWNVQDSEKFGTYQVIRQGALAIVPGISIFAQDNVAVEVAIGILGINYSRTDQQVHTPVKIEESYMQNSGANFKINPLSIEIGTSFYFYTGPHSKRARKHGSI